MAVIKRCVVCGKTYTATCNSKTCSIECRQINNKKTHAKGKNKCYYDNKRKKELKEVQANTLDHDIAMAKQMGISYGKYKAKQFLFREQAEKVANIDTSRF